MLTHEQTAAAILSSLSAPLQQPSVEYYALLFNVIRVLEERKEPLMRGQLVHGYFAVLARDLEDFVRQGYYQNYQGTNLYNATQGLSGTNEAYSKRMQIIMSQNASGLMNYTPLFKNAYLQDMYFFKEDRDAILHVGNKMPTDETLQTSRALVMAGAQECLQQELNLTITPHPLLTARRAAISAQPTSSIGKIPASTAKRKATKKFKELDKKTRELFDLNLGLYEEGVLAIEEIQKLGKEHNVDEDELAAKLKERTPISTSTTTTTPSIPVHAPAVTTITTSTTTTLYTPAPSMSSLETAQATGMTLFVSPPLQSQSTAVPTISMPVEAKGEKEKAKEALGQQEQQGQAKGKTMQGPG